jgi:hypothetical protein
VIAVGPWTIWLAMDVTARYPDVTAVLPQSSGMAKLVIDDTDAAALLQDLQQGSTSGGDVVPVMLDLGAWPALRWPGRTPGRRGPLKLIRSSCSGSATVVRQDPTFLVRALLLGFREVQTTSTEAPVLFRDTHRCYLVAHGRPAAAPVPAAADQQRLPAPGRLAAYPNEERNP